MLFASINIPLETLSNLYHINTSQNKLILHSILSPNMFWECVQDYFWYLKLIIFSIVQHTTFLDYSKSLACFEKFLALFCKFFIVHENIIIYLSNDTKASRLLNISGLCLEIFSVQIFGLYIKILLFLFQDIKNFQIAQSSHHVSRN